MKLKSAKFVSSVVSINHIRFTRLREIAFAGRSNVGKSSLINCLVNRKKLALTSSTPGKTRTLNYYDIDEQYYFVDLPGYGFARVAPTERQSWKKLVESYLSNNPFLRGVIQIIDSRHGITQLDHEMINWLTSLGHPTLVVATKTDKLARSKANYILQNLESEARELGIADIIPFSAVTKQGKDQIWRSIFELINRDNELKN
jgi:GTP-binding protein